jgi:ABC-type dipeptide/oligopeptide/nickel transport system permease component
VATVSTDAGDEREAAGVVPTARQGVAAVATTSALDAASTVLGLALAPVLVESNPVARAFFAKYGVLLTVVVVSVGLVATVLVATELGVWAIRERTTRGSFAGRVVRIVGYGTPSLVSLYAATNNVVLVVEHTPIAM